jgi:hypothetical protein
MRLQYCSSKNIIYYLLISFLNLYHPGTEDFNLLVLCAWWSQFFSEKMYTYYFRKKVMLTSQPHTCSVVIMQQSAKFHPLKPAISLSLSLSLSHTHTHPHTLTPTHTHTHTHSHSHPHTLTPTPTHTHTRMRECARAHARMHFKDIKVIQYGIVGKETCPKTGRRHLQ